MLLCFPVALSAQEKADLLIRNGRIIDGTDNSWYYGDVAVKDGKIVAIGKSLNASAIKIIDATGFIAAPGFIDVHGHLKSAVFQNPLGENNSLLRNKGQWTRDS